MVSACFKIEQAIFALPSTQEHDSGQSAERGRVAELVAQAVAVVQPDVLLRRNDHHEVRHHSIRTFRSGDFPVREVARLDNDRHAHFADRECYVHVVSRDVGDGDRWQRFSPNGLHRRPDPHVVLVLWLLYRRLGTLPLLRPRPDDVGRVVLRREVPLLLHVEPATYLILIDPGHHNRLLGERFDQVIAFDFEYGEGTRSAHSFEVGMLPGESGRNVGEGDVIPNALLAHFRDADLEELGIGVDRDCGVAKESLRIRRAAVLLCSVGIGDRGGGGVGGGEPMERRGSGRLEVDAFH